MPASPRDIPSIDILRRRPDAQALATTAGDAALIDALRAAAASWRNRLGAATDGDTTPASRDELAAAIVSEASVAIHRRSAGSLRPVVNATGVIVHTNLGRAPLSDAAIERIALVAKGYANLEYDIERGERGRRDVHAEALLCQLTGAEAAVVANNNAAATMLVLSALAAGREVVISRGELVEIGGGFRVPDILKQSGALLREVGTTNRTRAADYAAAVSERTAVLLRVHPSNFRMDGFVERPSAVEVTDVAHRLGLVAVDDLGSGNVLGEGLGVADIDRRHASAAVLDEPTVRGSLGAGFDIVTVSGDKLLGGPQAGIILGRAAFVDRVRRHPLMRAMRVDKLTYAALEATLLEHLAGRAHDTVPVARMIATPASEIAGRAVALATRLEHVPRLSVTLLEGRSTIGGGSAPGSALPTTLLAIEVEGLSADALESSLRRSTPPVIARIQDDRVVFDLRTVHPTEEDAIVHALLSATAV